MIDEPKQNGFPVYPHHNEQYTHHIREEQSGYGINYISVFEYKDCIREFDGRRWNIFPKPSN